MSEATGPEGALDRAIGRYHTILEEFNAKHPGECEGFLQRMYDARVSYAGRVMCPFLRPNFVTVSQSLRVEQVCRLFRGTMVKAKEALLEDPALLAEVALTEGEHRLAKLDPGFASIGVTTRLDTFLIGHDIKFVELNAECPAGIHYGDSMARAFVDFEPLKRFGHEFAYERTHAESALVAALRETWKEWSSNKGRPLIVPRVAVVDWKEVSTRTEFELVCEHLEREGIPARFVDPRDLELAADGTLTAHGEPIDVVYRRLLTNELLAREDECRVLVQAVEKGTVCLFNSFRAKMLHKKMIFAILQDPRVTHRYTADEAKMIRQCVPWTRRVSDTQTTGPDHEPIELVSFMRSNQQRLVIKPNDEYGGRGVIVGWNVEKEVWERTIEIALRDPSIVQERVALPSRPFPAVEDGRIALKDQYIDLDPYLFRGHLGGFLSRLSASSLCNVTAGGGSVPTFVIGD